MASGKPVIGGGDVHLMFHQLSQEALKITAEINGKYHAPDELHVQVTLCIQNSNLFLQHLDHIFCQRLVLIGPYTVPVFYSF